MGEKVDEQKSTYSAGKLQFKKELPDLPNVLPQALYEPNQDKNDFMNFCVTYTPEADSYWYKGKYKFSFHVPDEFPFNPPKVMCLTKIYHPNIDFQGNVCLNILKEDWKPTLSVASVIAAVYFLFQQPNPTDPLNHEAADVMRESLETFKNNVKKSLRGGYVFGQDFPRFISGYDYY